MAKNGVLELHDEEHYVGFWESDWKDNLLHVYSSCCGCDYNLSRKQTEQLRDFLTELLKESQDGE